MNGFLRSVVRVFLRVTILQAAIACALIAASRFDRRPSATIALAKEERPVVAEFPFIDVHTHLDPTDIELSIGRLVQAVHAENAAGVLFLPPPLSPDSKNPYDYEVLRSVPRGQGGEIAFLGGGGTLNVMIQQAVRGEPLTPELVKKFKAEAEEILHEGAVGFGEMAAEHFATGAGTYYEYAPPDHPLFLLLADISAEHGGIPIDLHMEAVPQAMKLPDGFASPPNPPQLHANIAGFEHLLEHNRGAKIVWAHAGWDNTGSRTPELMRRLLRAHPNLYVEIKIDPVLPGKNSPLADGGTGAIKPQWLRLFQDFSDRFVIGSDQHYPEPVATTQRWQPVVLLLNELPPDLRRKIGRDNPVHIYHLTGAAAENN